MKLFFFKLPKNLLCLNRCDRECKKSCLYFFLVLTVKEIARMAHPFHALYYKEDKTREHVKSSESRHSITITIGLSLIFANSGSTKIHLKMSLSILSRHTDTANM